MENTLFMYLDFLGFTELIKDKSRVIELFSIIDDLHAHKDPNYKVIVFSDTMLIYNSINPKNDWYKKIELMYLIEFAQDLLLRLIEKNIYFKAVITEGEFTFKKLNNIEAYFGQALVETYKAEENLKGTGLYIDSKLRLFNSFFDFVDCGDGYDYVLLTNQLAGIKEYTDILPIPVELITQQGLEFGVFQECQFLKKVHELMTNHPVDKIKDKYIFTWLMYSRFHSRIMNALADSGFNMKVLVDMDWSYTEKTYADWFDDLPEMR